MNEERNQKPDIEVVHVKDDFYKANWPKCLPVNKKGDVLLPNSKITKGTLSKLWPYLQVGGMNVHRMLAITFLECPGHPDDYQVNHIDGDKLNNDLSNLEWCTVQENVIHAYKTGLRNDNRPLLVKDLETGEIHRFYSLQAAARWFKVNGSLFTYYLKPKVTKIIPWRKKYSIIYEGDEWPEGLELGKTNGVEREIIVKELKTGKRIIFPSVTAASKILNIKSGAIYWYLNRRGVDCNNVYKGYEWWFLDEYPREIPETVERQGNKLAYENHSFSKGIRRKPSRVKTTDLATGEVKVWDSLWVIADALGLKKNSLEKAIWREGGVVKGIRYEYLGKE